MTTLQLKTTKKQSNISIVLDRWNIRYLLFRLNHLVERLSSWLLHNNAVTHLLAFVVHLRFALCNKFWFTFVTYIFILARNHSFVSICYQTINLNFIWFCMDDTVRAIRWIIQDKLTHCLYYFVLIPHEPVHQLNRVMLISSWTFFSQSSQLRLLTSVKNANSTYI